MIYEIYHKTAFKYESMVTFSHDIARLKPQDNAYQKLLDFSMEIAPSVYEQRDFLDIFGNVNTHMLIREAHRSLAVIGRSKVEIFPQLLQEQRLKINEHNLSYTQIRDALSRFDASLLDAKRFLFDSPLIKKSSNAIKAYALESFSPNRSVFEASNEFMGRIFSDFKFVSGFSDVTTPIEEIFEAKKGVCQDFAQFAIAALRTIGLPAKYMSGYIETIPQKGKEKLFGVDASHAWFALYFPHIGWISFDPTNNVIPSEHHILLGSGRDYSDISPLKGVVLSSGQSQLSIMVDVKRVY